MKKLQFIKKAVSGILCVGMLLESGTENLVYAAVINGEESVSVENSDSTTAVQQELPTGLMPVTEEQMRQWTGMRSILYMILHRMIRKQITC